MEEENIGNTEKLPSKIFKYYSFDPTFNTSRLTGYIFLASPWDFNDPNDCQLEVINNINDLKPTVQWLKGKLTEIGITDNLEEKIKKLCSNDPDTVTEVRTKQLEKLGVFCLSQTHDNTIIWGYYTNNKGFCIEYNSDIIIKRIIIGFINNLSWDLTSYLFEDKTYHKEPIEREPDLNQKVLEIAQDLFQEEDIELVHNNYLRDKDKINKLNFVRNVYIKRFGEGAIEYPKKPKEHKPTLFYDKNQNAIKSKYYTKGIEWKNEGEYRLTVSLGGRMLVNLGKDCIKSIRLGCNITTSQTFELISILVENDMPHIPLYKMKKEKNKLVEETLCSNELIQNYKQFKELCK